LIECVFTLDYELFGNGEGSLKDLVHGPAESLAAAFRRAAAPFVVFVEAAELEVIGAAGTDAAIDAVERQLRRFRRDGLEIGLHVHPQWYGARLEDGHWTLDHAEYNLAVLPYGRILEILERSLGYLRRVLGTPDFVPAAFRAGNWLFQPSASIARALVALGVKIDSSVFKGGLLSLHGVDYRPALKNGYWWPFREDVNLADPQGELLEFPIYTAMVPSWSMLTRKRWGLQKRTLSPAGAPQGRRPPLRDVCRWRYPLKFDFCRLTAPAVEDLLRREIERDGEDPGTYRPLVAIGHTKDLVDIAAVEGLLSFLQEKAIGLTTFGSICDRLRNGTLAPAGREERP
jgi:hypothetical protein